MSKSTTYMVRVYDKVTDDCHHITVNNVARVEHMLNGVPLLRFYDIDGELIADFTSWERTCRVAPRCGCGRDDCHAGR